MALGGLPTQAPAPAGPRPTPNRCACFDVYEPTALKRRPAIQGLEKLLFIQMWLTPHQFKPAVLIIIIMLIVLCFLVFFFPPIGSCHVQDAQCVPEWTAQPNSWTEGASSGNLPTEGAPPDMSPTRGGYITIHHNSQCFVKY